MRIFAATAAMVLALTGTADAKPWEIDGSGVLVGLPPVAVQVSNDGAYKLKYVCDGFIISFSNHPGMKTSDLPLSLVIDGKEFSTVGLFLDFSQPAVEFKIDNLRNLLAAARGDIKVRLLNKELAFSAQGSAAALKQADGFCDDSDSLF